jgi:uncharacterized Zn finger protein
MPCPTCSHTMHGLDTAGAERLFWCPRCGTVKSIHGDYENVTVPFLADRIRAAEDTTVRTSVDGRTLQYAAPTPLWVAICEAVGRKAHGA